MKAELREKMLIKRSQLSREEVLEKSKIITEKVFSLDDYKSAEVILCYISFDNEVSTEDLIKESLKNKRVVVPVTKRSLISELSTLEETKENVYGIREPVNMDPVNLKEIDIAFVPGIVFDKKCNRIGFGCGYFDRLLKKLTDVPKYALAFEFQVLDRIPIESHDVQVDYIITEEKIYKK